METTEKKNGWLVVIATAGFVIIWNTMGFVTMSESLRLVINGTFPLGIAVLFLLAYYHENESIVFRALIWGCEHLPLYTRGRKNAFFYFATFAIIGVFLILVGLGVINLHKRG